MRKYLENFFRDFNYTPQDSTFLCETYDRVIECSEAKKKLEEALKRYEENAFSDFSKLLTLSREISQITGIRPYTTDLLTLICLTRRQKTLYREKGISEQIFYDSMLDLRYKLDECKAVKGICGTFVAPWFDRFFQLTRFALGRLQFEVEKFNRNYEKNGVILTPGTLVLNTHIPRTGEPLDPESCHKSYELAKEFFKEQLGECPVAVCHSWLLFEKHVDFLPKTSNILKFMAEYDIIERGLNKDESELWRLFDTEEKNPDRLPADTSLRRAYVEYLKNGNQQTGWGFGVRPL